MSHITQLPPDSSYVNHEKIVKNFWKDKNVYNFVVSTQTTNDNFFFLDGPPFVSGALHTGHLFIGSLKDAVLRYHTMHGKKCANKFGSDQHGLPIEQLIMNKLNLKTSSDIENFGIHKFCDECKNFIVCCTNSWKPIYESIGRWVDFNDACGTSDTPYMETVWWTYKEMQKKGLTYKGYKVMPYSTFCETPLSNFEAGLNYKEKITNSAYVCFTISSNSSNIVIGNNNLVGCKFVAWTTTVWTLPSNVALCVGPTIRYVVCEDDKNNKYIVAENSIGNLKLNIISTHYLCTGSELVGIEYEPLFNYLDFHYHKVLADPYVKDSDANDSNELVAGTGIVHIAPVHGEDDCRICLDNGIVTSRTLEQVCLVNSQGRYIEKTLEYAGLYVFDADKIITKALKIEGKIIRVQEYRHQYPYCYRSDTPLIYMAVSSFFVEVSKITGDLVAMNDKITWTKKEIGENRFKNWIANAKDWCISRNRYFGTPIPVWESEDGTESVTIGSIAELVKLAKLDYTPTDIHFDAMKDIIIISETTGNVLRSCGVIFDCWFESGNILLSQLHYPFENAHVFDNREYLSDFVAEGLDQTRGWFYTLLIISTIIMGKPPFKTVICSGIILDENGQKMSKKYGNFVDPNELIEEFGADTLRLLMLKSPLINGESLLFKKSDAKDVFQRMTPYTNVVRFFLEHYLNWKTDLNESSRSCVRYINVSNVEDLNISDKWILESISKLGLYVETCMNDYKIDFVVKSLIDFVDDLANWYVKLGRDRIKGKLGSREWCVSLSVTYTVLMDYIIISAPFMPFLAEHLYQHLSKIDPVQFPHISVHCFQYPTIIREFGMSVPFQRLQKICKLIRSSRSSSTSHKSVKVPIAGCCVYHYDESYLSDIKLLIDIIKDEINCDAFEFKLISDDMKHYKIIPNFKVLGKRHGKNLNSIKTYLEELPQDILKIMYTEKMGITAPINMIECEISTDCFDIVVDINVANETNFKVIQDEGLMLLVDLTVSTYAMEKYEVRLFSSFIQNCRKKYGLRPWNDISIEYSTKSKFIEYLLHEYSVELSKITNSICKVNELSSTCNAKELYSTSSLHEMEIGIVFD